MMAIQISEELFGRLCKYFLFDDDSPENTAIIKNMLQDKADRIGRRLDYQYNLRRNRDG